MKLKFLSFLASLPIWLFAQPQISGVVNQYAAISGIDYCAVKLTISDGSLFGAGDRVVLLQMKGATMNETNTAGFGNIENLGQAGLFEVNEVLSVNGNDVFLKNVLLHNYNTLGALQLLTMPVYANATVASTLTASPWDGQKGGVLALAVEDTLHMEADLDVSGKGFRGGQLGVVNSNCTFLSNTNGYFYEATNWRGAAKGEGVAALIANKEKGRGAQSNGGGGGNDHNTGGGGGSNAFSTGGLGGEQDSDTPLGCEGQYPGIGGKLIPNAMGRVFAGGGGGAGHADDNGAGSSGGSGGGIVIIAGGIIQPNGYRIKTNGSSADFAGGDGAGGGGGGGTVWLSVEGIAGDLTVEAKGGNGGSVANSSSRCFGPGGGGGGGTVLANPSPLLTTILDGGSAGQNTVLSSQCNNGLTNGATAGLAGTLLGTAAIPASNNAYSPPQVLLQPSSATVCAGAPAGFTCQVQSSFSLSYQWQVNNGTGWTNLSNGTTYAGAQSPTLTLIAALAAQDGYQYRCVATNSCLEVLASLAAGLTVLEAPVADFTAVPQGGGFSFAFENNSTGAVGFIWDFGDGTTSGEDSLLHEFANPGTYEVSLLVFNDCGSDTLILTVTVAVPLLPEFTALNAAGCAPLEVQFSDLSTGNIDYRSWEFPGGSPASFIGDNPTILYSNPGTYDVVLTVAGNGDTLSLLKSGFIAVEAAPQADFSFQAAGLLVTFQNESIGGSSWIWDFGDGQGSSLEHPVHTYAQEGIFEVSLSVFNEFCGSAISTGIQVVSTSNAEVASELGFVVTPNPASSWVNLICHSASCIDCKGGLRNSAGQLISRIDIHGGENQIDLTGLPAGVYLLEVTSQDKLVFVSRVVKP
jgi:PKD repeat protein